MENKFEISLNISIKDEEGTHKSYDAFYKYNGDPKKLDVTVYINQWFLENNIDYNLLESFRASVWKYRAEELVAW